MCPQETTCDEDHVRCTTPAEIAACDGFVDGAMCNIGPLDPGHCDRGVCLRCGDGIVTAGEVCDDGNRADRDGCSADCQSDETCGNGIIDRVKDETCDDGNHLDHDGCSSTCQVEAPHWIQRPVAPPGRIYPAVAYDASRDRIVMTNGLADADYFNDTWEWAGAWEQPPPAPPLPVLIGAAATYDPVLQRTLLFGGIPVIGGGTSGGVFEWDGLTWQPGPAGPPRYAHAMVYDGRRKKVVVFGGVTNIAQETLELDSATSTWTVRTTATMPLPRSVVALAYDPKRGVVVMFGGTNASGELAETWEYDGTDWRSITPAGSSPSARSRSAMAYDPTLQEVVLFGGATNEPATTFVSDTWSWNGTRWAQITTPPVAMPPCGGETPPARGGHALVATATNIYLVGGSVNNGGLPALADTWRFDQTKWTCMNPPLSDRQAAAVTDTRHGRLLLVGASGDETWQLERKGPDVLEHSTDSTGPLTLQDTALGYDPDRDQLVLFSGVLVPGTTTATWTWTGTSWQPISAAIVPPSTRADAGFVWDPVGHTLVLFGGRDPASGSLFNDTWRWTGSDWAAVPIDDVARPPARAAMAIATDPVRRQIVMFGGTASPDALTWIWDGTAWASHAVTPHPPTGNLHPRFAWNPARQKLVLLLTPIEGVVDAWEWDGMRWDQVVSLDAPSGSTTPWAATAIDRNGVTLSISSAGESAELRWDATPHDEVCDGSDHDGDMLVRCADPDCWWTCAPLCPPGTSCDASAPACGDHHCDPLESCRTCPEDCTCTPVCGDFICDPNEICPGDCP